MSPEPSSVAQERPCRLTIKTLNPNLYKPFAFSQPSITVNDYVVVSLSLKFGDTELLDFTPKNPRLRYLPAIMDSGTSCLVIPDSTMNGLLTESPYQKWKNLVGGNTKKPSSKDTFHLNIAGATFDIGYDDWYLKLSNQSCVQKAPTGFGGILVGDVLFRRYVVLFDLRHYPESVVIGIGKQNPKYTVATKHDSVTKVSDVPVIFPPSSLYLCLSLLCCASERVSGGHKACTLNPQIMYPKSTNHVP